MSPLNLSLFDRPAPPANPASARRLLRPYQREAIDAVHRELQRVRSTAIVLHCGAGKTLTMAEWLREAMARTPGARGLWLANREFLIKDARARLIEQLGCAPHRIGIEKAEFKAGGEPIVVGSLQTLVGKRLNAWDPKAFQYIVGDEFHHFASPGAKAVLDHFEDAKILGGTATLVRHDKVGMWNACDSIAYERGIDVGIEDGYFVPVVPIARFIDAIHLEGIDTVQSPLGGKDLALGALEKEIAAQASAIAKLSVAEMGDRPTIIYTPGVASAHAVADTLNEMKPGCAKAVDADTPDFVRDRTLAEFGKSIQWIVNCGIYLEGLDVPNCRGIVIARPTKSESLYIQMAGRGGRPEGWIGGLATRSERVAAISSSGKPNFVLLDITGHAGRHSLCSAATLAGKASKSEKEEAAQILKDNEGITLGEALKEAQRREKSRIAAAAAQAEIEARRATFDPFRRHNIPKELEGIAPKWHDDPPTEGQLAWCADQLVENADKLTKGDIHLLITKAKEWEANGMATMRQRNILAQHDLPTDLPFKVAGELVFAVRLQKKRPPQVTVDRILAAGRQ